MAENSYTPRRYNTAWWAQENLKPHVSESRGVCAFQLNFYLAELIARIGPIIDKIIMA